MVAVLDELQVSPAPWTEAERRAWRPAERIRPSEWAERNRVLRVSETARPGPWRNRNAPYLVGIMDVQALIPTVEEVVISKPAQVGVSDAMRNVLACAAEHNPGPALVILPDKEKGRQVVSERFVPLFTQTESLRRLGADTGDDGKTSSTQIRVGSGFHLWLGYARSPSSLATHPCRDVFCDEINKYGVWSGGEADPVALAYQRTKTFTGKRLIALTSTPTTAAGLITLRLRMCEVVLHYYVPCPHCAAHQQLVWDRVVFEKRPELSEYEHADLLERERACWYECVRCGGKITEREKTAIVARGFWASDEQIERGDHIGADVAMGSILLKGLPRNLRRVGFEFESWVCTWVKCWDLAAKFLRVRHMPSLLMDFINSDLGRAFQEQTATTKRSIFSEKCRPEFRPQHLPRWTIRLYASVDVQEDHAWMVIRAWGPRLRSRRIWHGRIEWVRDDPAGQEALWRRAFGTFYPFEDQSRPPMACDLMAIDTRWRTHEAYRFVLMDPRRILPTKGATKPLQRVVEAKKHTYKPPSDSGQAPYEVYYQAIDTIKAKDVLFLEGGLVTGKLNLPGPTAGEYVQVDQWELNAEDDPVYVRHLSAEHRIVVRKGAAAPKETWEPKPGTDGRHNHYLDCEVMQYALAYMENIELLDESAVDRIEAELKRPTAAQRFVTPDGRPFLVTER